MDESEIDRRKKAAARIYTSEFISALAAEFKIPSEKIEILKVSLCYSAAIYQIQKTDEEEERLQIRTRDVRDELEKIENSAGALAKAFDSVSKVTRNVYLAPLQTIHTDYYLSQEQQFLFGYPIVRRISDDGKISIDFPTEHKIRNTIMLVRNLARYASGRTPTDVGGRPSSQALWRWVANMYDLWKKHLNRPFTYRQHQGVPISQAFGFCCSALKPIDPSISVPLVGTTMRAVIRDKGILRLPKKGQKGRTKKR